jgi:cobalamin-dependent methionine synthase I
MIIIGELINGTRKEIAAAIAGRAAAEIARIARAQQEAGAHFVDCNAGTAGDKEVEDLVWLVQVVQKEVSVPLSLDSSNPAALAAALEVYTGPPPLINSVTAEPQRYAELVPLIKQAGASVVALLIDEKGMPSGAEQRVAIGKRLVGDLLAEGLEPHRIFIDPVVMPVSTDHQAASAVLASIRQLREAFPDCHITAGVSNVSFGLPNRRLLNRIFLTMCMACGLDAALVDPLDRQLMAAACAACTLAGRDEWCMNYLQAHRSGLLE